MLTATPPVGDLSSNAMGTGARFNSGKVAFDLMPWLVVAHSLPVHNDDQQFVREALRALGEFQAGDDFALEHMLAMTAKGARISYHDLMCETAHVLDIARRGKYKDWNWSKGMPWSVPIAAAARHLLLGMYDDGRALDPETHKLHAGHVGCNGIFLMQYLHTYRAGDDRPLSLRASTSP